MRKLRIGWATLACMAVIAGCGGPTTPSDGGPSDAGPSDAGPNDGGTDVCEGRMLCTTAGASCDGDALVTCAVDGDGCMVETRTECAASSQVCDASGGTAACVDPCTLIPEAERCDTAARSCDGEMLSVCAADSHGCLVLEETDCGAVEGGSCDTSGTMPMCVVSTDPCADIPAAMRCDREGVVCIGDSIVECAVDAFGCYVKTTTDCSAMATNRACGIAGGGPACVLNNSECEHALRVTGNTTFPGEDLSRGGSRPTGSGCGSGSGAGAHYYEVTVPPGARVLAVATGGPDLVVFTMNACGDTDCTDYLDDAGSGSSESMELTNDGTSDITTIVGVRAYSSSTTTGTYDMSFTYLNPATNTTCATATPITGDTTLSGQNLASGGASPTGAGCGSGTGDYALYYAVTVPAGQHVSVDTARVSGDLVVFTQNACGDTDCASSSDWPEGAFLTNPGATDITTIVGVRSYGSSASPFDVSFTYGASSAANATCAGAIDLGSTPTTRSGDDTTTGGAAMAGDGCDANGAAGPDLWYSLTVPANTAAVVTVTPSATLDVVVRAVDSCGATSCLGAVDDPGPGGAETIIIPNSTGADATFYLDVGTFSGPGTFDINVTHRVLPTNGSCASATPITGDTTLTDEELSFGGARPTDSTCGFGSGSTALYYAVTVPPGTAVTVRTMPDVDIVLFTQNACSDTACMSSTDSSPERTTITNSGATPITRIVGVRGYSVTSGTFDIAFTYAALPTHGSCASAMPITANRTLTAENLSFGGSAPTGSGCSGSGSTALYYAVTVPPATAVDVVTAPDDDIVLFTQNACADTGCTFATDSSPERTTITNSGSTAITRIVGVRRWSGTTGTYNISFTYNSVTLAPNADCSTATAITTDTTITGENLAQGGTAPSGGGCDGSGATALYYDVTIPAGTTVTAHTASSSDIVLFTHDACSDTTCGATDYSPEETVITNFGAAPMNRIIGVRKYSGTTGTFDITFTYDATPPAYAVEDIPAACVTTGTWTSLSRSGTGDDASTMITAMPFTVTYFGAAMTHFSTNTNGLAQLWPSSSGSPSTAYANHAMSNSSTPDGVVAPFWDDLYLGTGYDIRTQTVGSAGSQVFVIEWNNALAGGSGDPITFQAQLYEGTDVIEFHYCSVGAAARATGSSATIGLRSFSGTAAVTVSDTHAGAVSTGSGFRLTPM